MKTGIICAIAFVALVNGLDEGIHAQGNHQAEIYKRLFYKRSTDDIHLCTPGATKKEDCNNCFCPPSGAGWACTRMECIPGLTYQDGTGIQPNQDEQLHRSVRQLPDSFTCVPNSTFMDDCNHCFCLPDGRHAGCTAMACPPKDDSLTTHVRDE